MTEELWLPCKGYEGLYEVSNLGRVRSCDRLVWGGKAFYRKVSRMKTPKLRKDGYLTVKLYKNNIGKDIRVHRLVAFAFIPNPNPKLYGHVNHIDCDRTNNRTTNLEWCNPLTNHQHSSRLNRMKNPPIRTGKDNPNSVAVIMTNPETGEELEFVSVSDGLRYLGIQNPFSRVSNVFSAIRHKRIAYGHRWRLKYLVIKIKV